MYISEEDLDRYHAAAKSIELDGVGAYNTVRLKYGSEIANVLLIAFLRRNFNLEGDHAKTCSTSLKVIVNHVLLENGISPIKNGL
jgi:hypothetical protein